MLVHYERGLIPASQLSAGRQGRGDPDWGCTAGRASNFEFSESQFRGDSPELKITTMTTSYIDLPSITISTLPFGGDLARHGAIKCRGTPCINFLLLPNGQFLVFYAAPVVDAGAVVALGRMLFEHEDGGALVYDSRSDESPQVWALPAARNQGRGGLQSARCWGFGKGETSARLDILDDPEWPVGKVQFGRRPTELLLHHVASIALWHWADLQDAAASSDGEQG